MMTVKEVIKNYEEVLFDYHHHVFDLMIYIEKDGRRECIDKPIIVDEIISEFDMRRELQALRFFMRMKAREIIIIEPEDWFGRYCIQIKVDPIKERKREKYEKRFNKKRA